MVRTVKYELKIAKFIKEAHLKIWQQFEKTDMYFVTNKDLKKILGEIEPSQKSFFMDGFGRPRIPISVDPIGQVTWVTAEVFKYHNGVDHLHWDRHPYWEYKPNNKIDFNIIQIDVTVDRS